MHLSISYASLFVVPSVAKSWHLLHRSKSDGEAEEHLSCDCWSVWVTTSQPPILLPMSTNCTVSDFPKLHPPPTISHRNIFAMPCRDMSDQHLLSLQSDAHISKRLKAKYEDDLKATIQELSELKQATRDIEKEDKKIICTNKINDLTAKIANLDEQLASLDEQIQRYKEENPPVRPLSQSERDEQSARMPKNRAFLDRIM